MKKLFALVLALVMIMSLAATGFATGEVETPANGTITIDDAIVGMDYSIYKILDAEYNETTQSTIYKVNDNWSDFVNGNGINGVYLNVEDTTNVATWVEGADVNAFVKAAKKYADDNKIAAEASQKNVTDTTVTFTGLAYGYYLLDSSLGALCSIDTNAPYVTIKEKNEKPTITKEVQEDSNSEWGEKNDATIGQTVSFRATITVQAGAQNYVMHDIMSDGLTFKSVTNVTVDNEEVDDSKYEVKEGCANNKHDDCDFSVVFDNDYIASLTAGKQIVVEYTATLNSNAVAAGAGNPNDVGLTYGDDNETEWDKTRTYTWYFDVLKYYLDGTTKKALSGAKFQLTEGDTVINLTKVDDTVEGEGENTVRVPTYEVDPNGTVTEIETDATGKFYIQGLDAGTYKLTETAAPAGYNKLSTPTEVTVSAAGIYDSTSGTATYAPVTTEVENKSGTQLPSTGGMGTTLFYVVGGIMVLAAVVLLVTKKRMSVEG